MVTTFCGRSGLRVSSIGLGTLTWGRDTDAAEACEMLARFVDAGGNLVECSPMHGEGRATDVLAEAVAAVGRHRVVLAWRGASRPDADSWRPAGGRGDMLRSLDDALQRLGSDFVDVWLVSPEAGVPLEETLSAAEHAHRTGRARYIGMASSRTWDIAEAVTRGAMPGGAPITAVEAPLSLVDTRLAGLVAELEDRGIGVFAASPLAGGALTGKYRHSTPPDSRAASPHLRHLVEPHFTAAARGVIEATVRAAEGLDRTAADVACAWASGHPGVSSAIIGPRTTRQLDAVLEREAPLPVPIRQVLNEVAGLP